MEKGYRWIALCTFSLLPLFCPAAMPIDYEALTGLQGAYNEAEKVFKVTFPRTDIDAVVDGVPLNPFMGISSWASFMPSQAGQYMVMGDLCLLQDEVDKVMSVLLDKGFSITALHNHFFYDSPRLFFMHFEGEGQLPMEAEAIKKTMQTIKDVRAAHPAPETTFEMLPLPSGNTISSEAIEAILGPSAQKKEGMVKFIWGRHARMEGCTLGLQMGIQSWSSFAGTDLNAVVDGDLVVHEDELTAVVKALRKGGIHVVAIHNHMINESPRLLFIHYWGRGSAVDLAKSVKHALGYLP